MMTSTGSIALGFGLIVSIGTRAQGVLPWIWSVQIGAGQIRAFETLQDHDIRGHKIGTSGEA